MVPPAYPPQKNSARSGPREHSASLYTKCTRFDIIAVLYTCTTVASRAAANARALTHARRSLWHSRLMRHTHTSTHLNVPNLGVLNPWSI